MTLPKSEAIEAIRHRVSTTIHGHWKLFLIEGVLMLILGLLAIALPNISTLTIELLVGWLFIVGGIFRTLTILRRRHAPGFAWSLAAAVLAVLFGAILIARPFQGVVTLTIFMSVFFVVEGIAAILIALEYRRYLRSWSWTLLGGLINLVMAYLIWQGWPNTANWVIGLYVGINMVFLGLPLIMTALAARTAGDGDTTAARAPNTSDL